MAAKLALTLLLFLPAWHCACAQEDSVANEFHMEGELMLRTADNLDSLLNLWYVQQGSDTPGLYDSIAPEDFPRLSDSAYLQRLSEIPSVVNLSYNKIVKNYIHLYTIKRRKQVSYMLGLTDYYFPRFEEIFDLYGVPYEIKYLSIIESALNPRAVSKAGAVGPWQFMYSTGKHYGLTINSLVDERRDPIASTHAAARFLKALYGMYGDWTLALAAYNCGPGNVNKAIRRSGGRRDFWDIYYYLPRETRGYVPAFIAATYTMEYHREHFIDKAPLKLPRFTDTLMVHEPLHLKQVAEVLEIPVELLRDINPQYRADIIPGTTSKPYALRIPFEEVGSYIDLEDSIFAYKDSVFFDPSKDVAKPRSYNASYRVDLPADKYDKLSYTVKSGDNVGYIADWYDIRTSDLRYWNNINRNLIRTGQKLVIYKPKGTAAKYRSVDQMSFNEKQAFAGRSVSSSSGGSSTAGSSSGSSASSASISASSGSPSASSPTSASLSASSGSRSSAGSNPDYITYKVRSGDTLWDIARKFEGVNEDDIARLNGLGNGARISVGQVLRIKPKA